MDLLGETMEEIAWQKGGIFKPGTPAFTSPQFPSLMQVLAERATELEVGEKTNDHYILLSSFNCIFYHRLRLSKWSLP